MSYSQRAPAAPPAPAPAPTPNGSSQSQPVQNTIDLEHKLPHLIQSYQDGWRQTCINGIVASCLLAALGGGLYVHIQEKLGEVAQDSLTPAQKGLLIVAYLTIISNCSAVIASFLIIDKFNEMPTMSVRRIFVGKEHKDLEAVFRWYRNWRGWSLYSWFSITCFFVGVYSIITELIMYTWLFDRRAREVQIATTFFALFGFIPIITFIGQHLLRLHEEPVKISTEIHMETMET